MLRITVLYNNIALQPGLETAWGMACLVEGLEKTILFDAGGDGAVLMRNMEKLDKLPIGIDTVILSHVHDDHTGGLRAFLEAAKGTQLYIPESFPVRFSAEANKLGHRVSRVNGPVRIGGCMSLTGEMGGAIKEQALILETKPGLVLITGCAHPGPSVLVKRAKEETGRNVHLLLGGLHLKGENDRGINEEINRLKELGVEKAGPSHCTGDRAMELFRQAWGANFIELGCGGQVNLEL